MNETEKEEQLKIAHAIVKNISEELLKHFKENISADNDLSLLTEKAFWLFVPGKPGGYVEVAQNMNHEQMVGLIVGKYQQIMHPKSEHDYKEMGQFSMKMMDKLLAKIEEREKTDKPEQKIVLAEDPEEGLEENTVFGKYDTTI